jgi:hypothetical protein
MNGIAMKPEVIPIDWSRWYAEYIVQEHTGRPLPR